MKINKLVCLLLAAVMLLSLAACGRNDTDKSSSSDIQEPAPTPEATPDAPVVDEPVTEVDNPVTYFSLSYGETFDSVYSMNAYANEDGSAHVDYFCEERKVGDLDAQVFHGMAAQLEKSGLAELNGKDVYADGEASASMYIEFADGTSLMVSFTGEIPAEFIQGFDTMKAYFVSITESLPLYVPQPMVMGEVNSQLLEEMNAILGGSGIPTLDTFAISEIPMDEYFGIAAGLSSGEGISAAVSCAPMMMAQAYSLVIVMLEDGADAAAVCSDFESNVDWYKWVCVAPSAAMIATKDNMVLCLMAFEDMYDGTASGVIEAGWTEVKTLQHPDM